MIYALPNQQVEEVTMYWIKNYPKESSFEKFSPHITIGFGEVEGETCGIKFPLRFSVSKLALCHLGNYCTCRDASSDICMDYASRDTRIRYYRNYANLGGIENFNRVFNLSQGLLKTWSCFPNCLLLAHLRIYPSRCFTGV